MSEMTEVNSSNLAAVGYDGKEHKLYIRFHTGRTYCYTRVPEIVWLGLMEARSKGSFFTTQVRDVFVYEVVDEAASAPACCAD